MQPEFSPSSDLELFSLTDTNLDSTLTFVPGAIQIRLEPMLRIQGYRDLGSVRNRVKKIASDMAELALEVFEPKACFRRCKVTGNNGAVLELNSRVEFSCPAFSKYLPDCNEAVAFVLTIGERFDQAIDELQEKEAHIEALFLDTAGWLGVEATSKQFASFLRVQTLSSERKITRRMSPGYSFKIGNELVEWSLYDQQSLFQVFAGDSLPVTVMESCAMLPRMSRSGIYGIKSRSSI